MTNNSRERRSWRVNFQIANPFRALDWRYRRARDLVAQGKRPGRWEDPWVRDFAKFYAMAAAGPGEAPDSAKARAFVDISQAYQITLDADLRAMIEAYILAEDSDEQIAARFHLRPAAINAFEKLFFHVRDRLEAMTWIVKSIGATWGSRPPLSSDCVLTAEQMRLTWRVFAYFGGTSVLDQILGVVGPAAKPTSVAEMDACLDADATLGVRIRSAVAAYWLNAGTLNALRLMRLTRRIHTPKVDKTPYEAKQEVNFAAMMEWMEPLIADSRRRSAEAGAASASEEAGGESAAE